MAKRNTTMLKWDHWHIELSSICTLKCPRCPRAEVAENLLNKQLTLKFFQKQIGESIAKQIRRVSFCGNDGDPIYCKELIEICKWFKQSNPNILIHIVTNGSYKPKSFWKELAETLDHNDEVHWSLDGWDQISNEKYRVNSDWNSIIQGIEEFRKFNQSTYRVWASIAFRFNQDNLELQKSLARELEFDLYQLTKSTKFGSKYPEIYTSQDLLEPTNPELVSSSHRFERELVPLSNKTRPGSELRTIFLSRAHEIEKNDSYPAICLVGNRGVFLNSLGEFYPCCWTANRYSHNLYWKRMAETKFNLWKHSFSEIINDRFWKDEFLEFNSHECRTKCSPANKLYIKDINDIN